MPRMIPDIPDSRLDKAIENTGERTVYRELRRQLPENWVVRHSYAFTYETGADHLLRDGEADFIIAAPGRGLVFLEVKASDGYDSEDGQWYRLERDGRRMPTDSPFVQAMRTKHMVVGNFRTRLGVQGKDFPGVYGHAVVYPRARVHGRLPASQDPQVVMIYRDMQDLRGRLEDVFSRWGTPQMRDAYTTQVHQRVVDFLRDEARFVAVLAADADEDSRRIEELTRQQYDAFRTLLANPRVRVDGVAGSGKTMIALWTAQALASQGMRVLLLCFNRLLVQWLRSEAELSGTGLEVSTFFALCKRVVEVQGGQFQPPAGRAEQNGFWIRQAPDLFTNALERMGTDGKYDVVVVDEAQDFHPDWWVPVEFLLRNPQKDRLYILYDSLQAGVYGGGGSYPAGFMECRLEQNCRNSKQITAYAGRTIARDIPPFELSPTGVVPTVGPVKAGVAARAALCRDTLRKWVEEQFAPSRLAVLSPWDEENPNCALSHLTTVASYPFLRQEAELSQWRRGEGLWKGTVKSFKGLEADCVVITDVPQSDTPGFSSSDLYVAVSRAKHQLVLLPSSPAACAQLQAWAQPQQG